MLADRVKSQFMRAARATPEAAIIGAGPAGLMAAETLGAAGIRVTVYDRMASPGRKFLMAGRGGLNLTHGEELERFLSRYGEAAPRLRAAIEAFPPSALRAWCEGLGQETFAGTSGRIFPKAMKTSPLLRAWLARLAAMNVAFKPRHRWSGWDADGGLSLRRRTDASLPKRMRSSLRWAGRAGRGSARTAAGPGCWPGRALRFPR